MQAMYYERFGQIPIIADVSEPACAPDSIILQVRATGICLSDWHGWQGHDPDIALPHVPGHEFAGEIHEIGSNLKSSFSIGQRVTSPFIQACGTCGYCLSKQSQVCAHQRQAGFTHWGSFAEYVEIPNAAYNLIAIDEQMTYGAAALLGCRFGTAFHAVMNRTKQQRTGWSLVFGCGGVGQAIIQIERSLGHQVIAVDRKKSALQQAQENGAVHALNFDDPDFIEHVQVLTDGSLQTTYDAVGSYQVLQRALQVLGRLGRHLQVGLLPGSAPAASLSLGALISHELEIVGCHGIARASYGQLMNFLAKHELDPARMITQTLSLQEGIKSFTGMQHESHGAGVAMIHF